MFCGGIPSAGVLRGNALKRLQGAASMEFRGEVRQFIVFQVIFAKT